MNIHRVKNDSVWQSLRILFIAAAALFLINIYFGFDNALAQDEIPRWQILIHLHGGSIGWITLSAVGLAIWLITGDRQVDAGYEGRVRTLVWATIIAFGGYVPSFGLAFSRPGGFLVTLLPIFGSLSVLMLWLATIFSISELRKQTTVNTPQLLIAGALLTASIGGTVGMLLGLERVIGQFLPLPPGDRVGAHAGMMDTYLFLVASAIVEWLTSPDYRQPSSIWGKLQAVIWSVGAAIVPIAYFINAVDTLLPIFMLTLLIGLLIFIVRSAWGAIKRGPFGKSAESWAFFGTLWLITYMVVFVYLITQFVGGADFMSFPSWLMVLFAHAGFVGMMTNLIFGALSVRTKEQNHLVPWGETAALWIMNLGLLTFVGLSAVSGTSIGAMVMGVGVLLGVFTYLRRLFAGEPATV